MIRPRCAFCGSECSDTDDFNVSAESPGAGFPAKFHCSGVHRRCIEPLLEHYAARAGIKEWARIKITLAPEAKRAIHGR